MDGRGYALDNIYVPMSVVSVTSAAQQAWQLVYDWARKSGHVEIHHFGGYLVYRDRFGCIVCQIPLFDKYCPAWQDEEARIKRLRDVDTNAREKGERIYNTPGALSSAEGRDVRRARYIGGIRLQRAREDETFSFSGMSEHVDELVDIVTAELCPERLLDRTDIQAILRLSNNELALQFLRQWRRPEYYGAIRLAA